MTFIFPTFAASIPASESSKTNAFSGFTFTFSHALKKISGFGFPFSTSSPHIISLKYCLIPAFSSINSTLFLSLEVATTVLYFFSFKNFSNSTSPSFIGIPSFSNSSCIFLCTQSTDSS